MDRVFTVGPNEAFRVWVRGTHDQRPRLLMNLDPQLAQAWSFTNGTTDRTIDCNDAGAQAVFGDGLYSLVALDLAKIMPGMVLRTGSGVAAPLTNGRDIFINHGETFRVVQPAGPGVRAKTLMELNPANGRLWTTSNVTTDRTIDANGALAVVADGITSFVEDMKTWFPGMFNANAETSGGTAARHKPHDFKVSGQDGFRVVYRPGGGEPDIDLLNLTARGVEQAWTVTNLTADRSIDANGAAAVIGDACGQLITDVGGIFPGLITVS